MQVDGQTIKPLLDYAKGGIPAPPMPAYIQYIKGSAFKAFRSDQILYRPFRPRSWCIYGQSRVENILSTVALYQMHENWASDYFTQGNIPEVLYLLDSTTTKEWTPAKLKEWQEALDKIHGDNVSRRRVHIAPPMVKDAKVLKDFKFDRSLPDWLVRLVCIEFGVPSYLFTSETNRSTAKEMNEALYDTPLRMDLMSMKRLYDEIIATCGMPEMEFEWSKEYDYDMESVAGIVALTTPSPVDGKRVMEIPEGRAQIGLDADAGADQESAVGQDEPEGGDGADTGSTSQPGSATAPSAAPTSSSGSAAAPQKSAGSGGARILTMPQAAQPEAGRVVSTITAKSKTAPQINGKRGKRFAGRGAADRARLASGFAPVILKRLRQQQAEIVKKAVERARSRGKKVEEG